MTDTGASTQEQPSWNELLTQKYGDKLLFSKTEVAEILGCSRSMVYVLCKRKILDTRYIGSSSRITRLSVLDLLNGKTDRRKRKKRKRRARK